MKLKGFFLFAYLGSFVFMDNYCSANETKELWTRTLPVYAMLANVDQLNSSQCRNELKDLREAIDQRMLWGLKVLDASGEPKSGFLYGNNYWLGSRSQCEDVNNKSPFVLAKDELKNNSIYRPIEDEFPPYNVKFFAAHFTHNSTMQYHVALTKEDLIILGLCLPVSCSKDQLSVLLETVFKNRILLKGELYLADFTLVEVKDLIDDYQWTMNGTFITMTIIIVLTILLMIIGTIYDVMIYQKRLNKYEKYLQDRQNDNSQITVSMDTKDDLEKIKSQNLFMKILQSFSIYTNTKIIFNVKTGVNSVPIIHGLKFLTMFWMLIGHTTMFLKNYIDNKPMTWRKSNGFFNQIVVNLNLTPDTFFFISGFLVAYLYLKSEITKDKRKPYNYLNTIKIFFLIILKRFIRLTPTYMIIIGFYEIITTWSSKTTLFYITDNPYEMCSKYWWRNILYIQNLFTNHEICMIWSWYLANDMQYFVITIFLLLLSSIYFKVAASLFVLIFISSTILTGYISYIHDYVPTLDMQFKFIDELYYPPWIRIGPYLVGVIAGYILIKLDNKLKLKKKTLILFWILGISCCLSVFFGLSQRMISVLASAFYTALNRTVWAIGIAWILIACCTNNGGILNRILSLKIWIPLSRLTYIVYLINPIVINSIGLCNEISIHGDILIIFPLYLGITIICYVCSFVISLMFETPYYLLTKEGFNYINKKT